MSADQVRIKQEIWGAMCPTNLKTHRGLEKKKKYLAVMQHPIEDIDVKAHVLLLEMYAYEIKLYGSNKTMSVMVDRSISCTCCEAANFHKKLCQRCRYVLFEKNFKKSRVTTEDSTLLFYKSSLQAQISEKAMVKDR